MADLKNKATALELKSLVGHSDQVHAICRGVQEKMSASFILSGSDGIGKKKAAIQTAQKFLCVNPSGNQFCGVCPSCKQIFDGQSVSVTIIEPASEMIRVDEIQKLLNSIHLRSLTKKRFVIIDQVEKMNLQAANTILKTLEEPPEGLYFFLITSQISKVLKTIRSRCQIILFQPLDFNEMKQIFPSLSEAAFTHARGQVGKAVDTMDVEHQNRFAQCQQFLNEFFTEDFLMKETGWREFMKNKENFLFLLTAWEELLLEGWKLDLQNDQGHAESGGHSSPKSSPKSSQKSDQLLSGLLQIRRQMKFRPDDVLQIEGLWTKLSTQN
ncbi:MAG: hypothetical protein ACK5P5_08540 [Pseudobdellovibrionaceae bacterium]